MGCGRVGDIDYNCCVDPSETINYTISEDVLYANGIKYAKIISKSLDDEGNLIKFKAEIILDNVYLNGQEIEIIIR